MTGRLAASDEERRLREAAEGYLAKPFESHDVIAAVQSALGETPATSS